MSAALAHQAAAHAGQMSAIAYRNLATGAHASVNGREVVHAASTVKVPVMVELFARADRAELDLQSTVVLRNEFHGIVDGSPHALEASSDSDPESYAHVGQPVTIAYLMERMITRSSNLATNALIALAGAARVTATGRALGMRATQVLRGIEDGKAFARGPNNVTTADDLAALLGAIALEHAASPRACRAMRSILARQEDDELIPAGLPHGTHIEHKTGQITGHRHDMAIVVPADASPYVLVVLTRGFATPEAAAAAIADVARTVHALHLRQSGAAKRAG